MDKRAELLQRVRDDAATIAQLVGNSSNVPLEHYVDKPGLNALCDSLSLEAEAWQLDDLERILIIRDGLYDLRNKLRDTGDEAEHSVDQILSSVDRLYADLERAFREINPEQVKAAQAEIAALQRGPHIAASIVPKTTTDMQKEASEVLVQAHTSIRHIEINLLKIDRSNINFEILRNMKLTVQRLSASVFAIKLSLEQTVVYQGIFKLLTDGADKIVEELKRLLQQMKSSYDKAADFVGEITALAEKGTRFARLVAEFLNKAFAQADRQEVKVIKLRVQITHQGEAILCGSADSNGKGLLAGRNGNAWKVDAAAGRIVPRYRLSQRAVHSVAHLDDETVAIGTEEGLQVVSGDERVFSGSFRERVIATAVTPWGAAGSRGTIITGSREGIVRRWTLAGGLSQFSEESFEKIGRHVHALVVNGNEVVAASGLELVFLDRDMRTTRTMRVPFEVNSMDAMNRETLILCGQGNITHVNLASGLFARVITASNTADYTCVARRDAESFFFGTKQGKFGIMELASGEELGYVDVQFELRGIVALGQKVVVYGGDWNNSRGRSAALITMETETKALSPA
jgi:hypothetical protein